MLAQESGTLSGSDLYFLTPSELAREMLFYPVACGYYYTNYDYHIVREDYNNYLLFYVCDGRLSVTSEGTTKVARKGQVGLLNCHKPHDYHTIGSCEFVWVHLDGSNMEQFYQKIVETKGGFVFSSDQAEEIRRRIYEFVYASRNNQAIGAAQQSLKLYHMLILLLDGSSMLPEDGASKMSEITEHAMRYIEAHYEEELTLQQLSAEVSMSQYHFSRIFKKECGYSPYEYIVLTRMNRAMYLLKTTDLPIKEVAQAVGYHSQSTFSAAFSNRAGLSPKKFREYPL